MKTHKGFTTIILLGIMLALFAIAAAIYFKKIDTESQVGSPYNMGSLDDQYSEVLNSNPTLGTQNPVSNTVSGTASNVVPAQTHTSQSGSSAQQACLPNDPASITITKPIANAVYTVGQPITVQWISCNVLNLSIGLLKGGKDFGTLTQPSIPASTGSFTFTATNPAEAFNGMTTNAYQVGLVQSESPNVLVKSPSFTVHQ